MNLTPEKQTVNYFKDWIKVDDGVNLFLQGWNPENPRGIVCLVHGLGEHSGRYQNLTNFFVQNELAIVGIDLHGHGKTCGKRGHVSSYDFLMDDISILLNESSKRFPNLPQILYGHSMGGNLVLNYVLRFKPEIAGVIASAPWLRLALEPPRIKIYLGFLMSNFWPKYTQSNGIKSSKLSRVKDVVEKYEEDPLVHDKISAKLFTEVYQAGEWALQHALLLDKRTLVMHGSGDDITSHEASREFAKKADKICTFKEWPGFYHELHNEPEKEKVYHFILKWINGLFY